MNRIKIAFREFLSSLKKNDGMTLIEIMIVVAIIGILIAVIAPKILDKPNEARQTVAKQKIHIIELALTDYYMKEGNYPTTLEELVPKYIAKSALLDPWENTFQYEYPGTHESSSGSDYDIWSYGADKQEGGEGFNADITNWDSSEQ